MFRSAATKLAHNSTIPALGANSDLKPLQDLILAEKQVLNSLQRLSSDLAKNAEALRIWGSGEGDDLGDILGASATLLATWASSVSQFSAHEHPMRDHLKAIRTREENLDDLKRRRKSVGAKADAAEKKLSKMGPEHKNLTAQTDSLNALRAEIRSMDSDIMTEEAALGDFKRTTTKVWMGLKFGALVECSEKGTIVGEYGKLIVGEVPEEKTQPGMARSLYYGRQKTEQLLSEAHRVINEVVLYTVPINHNPQPASQQPEQQPDFQPALGFQNAPQLPVNTPQSMFQIPGIAGPNVQTSQNEWQLQSQPPPPQLQPQLQQPQHIDDQYLYLPVPQGLGTGQFIEQPDSPASLHHQRYPSQSGQPNAPYPVAEQPVPLSPHSVDDFGINTSSPGLVDPPGPGTGGRFATFPVKNRGYNLAEPQAAAGRESESFSSSVAQALPSPLSPPGTVPHPSFSYEVSPIQDSPQPHQVPPHGTPVQDVQAGRLSLHHEERNAHSDDEGGLAYDDPHDDPSSRHVRFGGVQDMDEELEARNHSHGHTAHNQERQVHEGQVHESHDHQAAPSPEAQPPQYEDISPVTEVVNEPARFDSDASQSVTQQGERFPMTDTHFDERSPMTDTRFDERSTMTDTRFQNQRRIPPPVFDPAEEERMLNAAAAREVSREMDALIFNPPIAQQDQEHLNPSPIIQQGDSGYGVQPNAPVDADEQLVPPSAPYMRELSPNEDSPILPHQLSNTPLTMDNQPIPQSPYPPEPIQQQPRHPPFDFQPASPRHNNDEPPRLPPIAPIVTQLPSSPYPNPPSASGEYPRGLGAFPGPMTKSTSSLTASGPVGARTISAAAFKRPSRVASTDMSSSDVTPLSIKKRLPSSPYPQGRESSPVRLSRSGSPAKPPAPAPSHPLPPIPRDEEYDFISAYVDSGAPEGTTVQRGRAQSGYGDGKFSTDLEGSLR